MIWHNVYMKCEPYMTFREIITLYELVKTLPFDGKILELGAWKGGSSVLMGEASQGTNRRITVVDIWEPSGEVFKVWTENVEMAGLLSKMEVKIGDSLKVLEEMKDRVGWYDLCLIDSDHGYDHALAELEYALRLVKAGGWIMMHDIGEEGEYHIYPGCTRVWYERARHILKNQIRVNSLYGGQKFDIRRTEI